MNKNNEIVIQKKHIIIGIIIILLLLAGALVVGLNWHKWFGGEAIDTFHPSQSGNLEIDPGAGEWNGDQIPDKSQDVPAVGIKIPGYPSIELPPEQADVAIVLLNPEGNPCYFKFELVLKDSDESLYQSELVPPGQAITQLTLARGLSAGEYHATIKITTYSTVDQSPMNGANVETVLIVK